MSAKKTQPPKKSKASRFDPERLWEILKAERKEYQTFRGIVERILRDVVCARCGHLGRKHFYSLTGCDRCLRDSQPARGYRSRTHRHPFVAEVAQR
jgi:hypothetical protein